MLRLPVLHLHLGKPGQVPVVTLCSRCAQHFTAAAGRLCLAFEQQGDYENMRNILQMLEEVYRSNYSYRVNLAKFILLPTTIVCIGSMVGFVAYAIFSAMIAIITQLVDLV